MKAIHLILSILIFFLFSSCDKTENPYVDKQVIEALIKAQNPEVEHVAVIYNKDIYYLSNLAQAGIRVTNTPGNSKTFVKMSHNHKQFAYLDGSGTIVIVNLQGQVVTTLPQYGDVKSFDWSADDKTLYILNNNEIAYYGPSMNLPEITYNGLISGMSMEVLSASVSMQGDLAYIIHGFSFLTGDKYKMIIKPANKAADIVFEDNSTIPSMRYVAFSSNKQDLVLGYSESTYLPNHLTKIYVFIDLQKDDHYYFGSKYGCFTPLFNESKSFLVAGCSSGSDNIVKLAALGVNKQIEKNIYSNLYTTQNNVLYTDWK
jgi:hypothetical protein